MEYTVWSSAPFPAHIAGVEQIIADVVGEWVGVYSMFIGNGVLGVSCTQNFINFALVPGGYSFPGDQFAVTRPTETPQGITGFDMRFNMDPLHVDRRVELWSTAQSISATQIHLRTVARHEVGHVVGLGDRYTVGKPTIMEQYTRGTVEQLLDWDREAVKHLYANDVCGVTEEMRWGGLKALFSGYSGIASTGAFSGTGNTVVWQHMPGDSNRYYFVYREEGESDEIELVASVPSGDTLWVDTTAVAGMEYRYRVASADSSILHDLGMSRAGLKLVSDVVLADPQNGLAYDVVVRRDRAYIAFSDRIQKYNISDPVNPVLMGSRTNEVFDTHLIHDMAISEDGARLYVQTLLGFVVIDATSSGLPILGQLPNLVTGSWAINDAMTDMLVDDEIVYIGCAGKGLYAIDVSRPFEPRVAGVYDPSPSASYVISVEETGARLFVTVGDASQVREDRLLVTKTLDSGWLYPEWDVDFAVECTSLEPACTGNSIRFPVGVTTKGMLSAGYDAETDSYVALVPGADPAERFAVRPLESATIRPAYVLTDPLGVPSDTIPFYPDFHSFDFDSRFIYATTPMFGDRFDRSLVVFDLWGSEAGPLYVAGDTLGSSLGATVKSQGKHVYVLDDFKATGEAQREPRFRVYEKASGCVPDPIKPVRLYPEAAAYRVGDAITVGWGVGCPEAVTIEFLEDGVALESFHSESYEFPDDIAYRTTWTVPQMPVGMENHSYQVRVSASYAGAASESFVSAPFRIETRERINVAVDGSGHYTSIQGGINAASSGDTVHVKAGTYAEHLTLKSNIRVVSPSGAVLAPVSAGVAISAVDLVHPPTIDGLAIQYAPGIDETALHVENSHIKVSDCTFTSLTRAVRLVLASGEFDRCTFSNNYDATAGGAVWINAAPGGPATAFRDCEFAWNSSGVKGGAVYLSSEGSYEPAAPQVRFERCTFRGNSAPDAAAVRIGAFTRPSFESCLFESNHVSSAGSGIVAGLDAGATVTNGTFAGNTGAGAYEIIDIGPIPDVSDAVTISSTVFANNESANALASSGDTYTIAGSNFFGNGDGDATWSAQGIGNFSEDPAFCGEDDYSIHAFSPCAPGVRGETLIGALPVGCVPDAVVTLGLVPNQPPDSLLFGCPAGDADSFVVSIDFDDAVLTRAVGPSEVRLAQPYATNGIWSDVPLHPSSAASAPGFATSIAYPHVSGTGVSWVDVLLNGHALDQRIRLNRRGPDLTGDGQVQLADFAMFGVHWPPNPYGAQSDFDGNGVIALADFTLIGAHMGHTHPFAGALLQVAPASECAASVTLRFEEDDPLGGEHRLRATVSLENAESFKAALITLTNNNPVFEFLEWHPHPSYPQATVATDLLKDGQKVIMIGAIGSKKIESSVVELGYFDLRVNAAHSVEVKAEDFGLVGADILSIGDTQMAVPSSSVRRTYAPPVYRNQLRQNYPNPFNPTTTVAFSLAKAERTELSIFDVTGALVKTVISERRPSGNHRVVWTGDNQRGNQVASGVYFYRLTAGTFRDTKKMVLVR